MADKYIPRSELRLEPFNLSHDTVDNKYLEMLQGMTKDLVDKWCGQEFEPEGTEEEPVEKLVDGTGKDTVFLPKRLITCTAIRCYYALNDYYEYSGDDIAGFLVKRKFITFRTNFLDVSSRVIGFGDGQFPIGQGNIGIVGIWGWEACPDPVKYLQGRLIQKIIEDGSFAQKFEVESVGDYSATIRRNVQKWYEEITGDFELDTIIKQYRGWIKYGKV